MRLRIFMLALGLALPTIGWSEKESYYFQYQLGFLGTLIYPADLTVPVSKTGPGLFTLAQDLGVYWSLGERTLLGAAFTVANDFPNGFFSEETTGLVLYAPSLEHYFDGSEIGDGFFTRLDGGIARTEIRRNKTDLMKEWGLGLSAGFGTGWPVSSGTRLKLGLYGLFTWAGSRGIFQSFSGRFGILW